jgi:hypothetical protein
MALPNPAFTEWSSLPQSLSGSDVDSRYDIPIFVEISRYRYFRYFSAYRCIDTRYSYNKLNYHCFKPKNGRKVSYFQHLCKLYSIHCKVKLFKKTNFFWGGGDHSTIPSHFGLSLYPYTKLLLEILKQLYYMYSAFVVWTRRRKELNFMKKKLNKKFRFWKL